MTYTKTINRYTLSGLRIRSGHCPQLLLKTCRTQQEIVLVRRILTFWKYSVQEEDEEKDSPVMMTACPEFNWMDPQYQQKDGKQHTCRRKRVRSRYIVCDVINVLTHSLWILLTMTCSIYTWAPLDITKTMYKWTAEQFIVWLTSALTDLDICINTCRSSGLCPENFRVKVQV